MIKALINTCKQAVVIVNAQSILKGAIPTARQADTCAVIDVQDPQPLPHDAAGRGGGLKATAATAPAAP